MKKENNATPNAQWIEHETLQIITTRIVWNILGLSAMHLERLRVTVKANHVQDATLNHLDSLDLYNSRSRNNLISDISNELGLEQDASREEVKNLVSILDAERLKLRESSSTENATPPMSDEERKVAMNALKHKDLVGNVLKDFTACGMIGEEKGKLLGYLGTISRLLPKPIGVIVISRSGAGKTTLQNAVCSFVPPESLIKYSRVTGKALFYKEEDSLKHKVLAVEEEEGMSDAIYSVKLLQSDQRLSVATTRSDPKTGRLKTDEYEVKGPVFIMIATTNPDSLDAETRSRFIIATIDESREQTKRILDFQRSLSGRKSQNLEGRKSALILKNHNMQRLLKSYRVENPLLSYLEYPCDVIQSRRDWDKYLSLMNAIAILHQYQRTVKKDDMGEYIEVQIEDVALANELAYEFFPNGLDEMAPHTRTLGLELSAMVEENKSKTFTIRELRRYSGWSDWSCRQGIKQLEKLGYIVQSKGKNGISFSYDMLVDVRAEERKRPVLSDVKELRKRLSNRSAA